MTDAEWRDERRMLERLLAVLGTANVAARDAAATAALAMPHASLRAMTEATFACYDAAVGSAPSASTLPTSQPPSQPAVQSLQPFTAVRVRDALGYRAWTPPPPDRMAGAPGRGVGGRIAHAAVAIRHKLPGRILYRLAPASLVERLRHYLR